SVGDTAAVAARGTAPHHRAAGQGGGAAVEDAAARASRNVVLDRDVHQRQRALVQDRPAVRGDLAGRVTTARRQVVEFERSARVDVEHPVDPGGIDERPTRAGTGDGEGVGDIKVAGGRRIFSGPGQ